MAKDFSVFITFKTKYPGEDEEEEPAAFLAALSELENLVEEWANTTHIDTEGIRVMLQENLN